MLSLKTYEGHIRNHKSLCKELEIPSNLPRSKREEEILKLGYKKWGKDICSHIYGMFSFSLYDDEKDELFIARDQFGTKTMYYYFDEDSNTFLHGIYLESILKDKSFKKELNESMLQIYLSLTYVAGENTFFKDVKKLMPGHILIFKNNKITIEKYFEPTFQIDRTISKEEYSNKIHNTLVEIMKEVKDDEEEVQSFLSGGVDSSYVLALSDAKECNSCGYKEERFDESKIASKTAEVLKRKHNIKIISPEEFFGSVSYVMKNMEQPIGDASAIVFALGCIETAKHTSICYSGEGADEFFGGYNMYRNANKYKDELKNFYVGNTNIMKEEDKKKILKNYDEKNLPINLVKDVYENNKDLDPLSQMSNIDIRIWLEGDIYLNIEKMSHAANLEVRMPITDLRIFEIASKMPPEYKVDEQQNKIAFRDAAAKVLPEEVAYRKKLGFIVPIRIWMADRRYNKDIIEKFNSEYALKFFDTDAINDIFNNYISGDSDLWRQVWVIYTFLVWYEEYFIKNYKL